VAYIDNVISVAQYLCRVSLHGIQPIDIHALPRREYRTIINLMSGVDS